MNESIIPTHTDSYDTLSFVHTKCVSVYKRVGYTPLQVVESIRPYLLDEEKTRVTYVGRLDPMAEGWMHVLWSGDMEEKKVLADLHKTYEVDVVFNIQTDTGDALGLVTSLQDIEVSKKQIEAVLQDFVGPFTYAYPTYSSPHIKKTLKGEKYGVEEVKYQRGHIYSIEYVSDVSLRIDQLQKEVEKKIAHARMPGDFRIENIQACWKEAFEKKVDHLFLKATLRVMCGSGTYMRTLAEELAKKISTHAFALHIRRIGIHKK